MRIDFLLPEHWVSSLCTQMVQVARFTISLNVLYRLVRICWMTQNQRSVGVATDVYKCQKLLLKIYNYFVVELERRERETSMHAANRQFKPWTLAVYGIWCRQESQTISDHSFCHPHQRDLRWCVISKLGEKLPFVLFCRLISTILFIHRTIFHSYICSLFCLQRNFRVIFHAELGIRVRSPRFISHKKAAKQKSSKNRLAPAIEATYTIHNLPMTT